MSESIRVNVSSGVDNSKIKKDVINGRDVIIVPSATMPAGIIMNDVLYPEEVIANSYMSLDRAPAPCGHPKLNGQFISARDPEAVNHFHIGAWNSNVRWEGKKILVDKVIDIEIANSSEMGRRVLSAIEQGKPISTSTGLIAEVSSESGEGYSKVAKSIIFDHDAILLDEPPAATPEQGVGMLVNGKQIPVHNYSLDGAMRELDWAGQEMIRSLQRAKDATIWEKIRDKVLAVIAEGLDRSSSVENEDPSKEVSMSTEEIKKLNEEHAKTVVALNELTAKFNSVDFAALANLGKAMEEMSGQINGLISAKNAEDEKNKQEDQKAVVDAGLMNAEEAKQADPLVVNALANKAREMILKGNGEKPKAPALLRGNLQANSKSSQDGKTLLDHFVD